MQTQVRRSSIFRVLHRHGSSETDVHVGNYQINHNDTLLLLSAPETIRARSASLQT